MGRYAHRFRAFAVTGSDLASCTEEDLIQIGISFRCVVGVIAYSRYDVPVAIVHELTVVDCPSG